MPRPRQRLFAPGSGAAPPVLTGRKAQQDVLRNCLADLIAGASPPHDVVLIGPRGNGKTVLLNWFKQVARSAEPATDVIALTPDEAPTPRTLTDLLAPRCGLAKLLPRKVGVSTVGSVEWDTSADTTASLKERLIARCRAKPLAVLIDEAHTLDANDLDRVWPVVVLAHYQLLPEPLPRIGRTRPFARCRGACACVPANRGHLRRPNRHGATGRRHLRKFPPGHPRETQRLGLHLVSAEPNAAGDMATRHPLADGLCASTRGVGSDATTATKPPARCRRRRGLSCRTLRKLAVENRRSRRSSQTHSASA